jgi:Fe-S-cluster-containing dehydrogenase component/DMSO reductase anchor subunit
MILTSVDAVHETPVDRYLREQRDLSAVERFAKLDPSDRSHRQARYYRDLIPASPPAPGQQYAFEVDLDACTGCKACVAACHSLNGLDDGESWRTVNTYHGARSASPWQQTVTSACHHCLDPACLAGCPVDAYDKDPVTGIVVHLDDQCIGCSYCTLTCPYEVPVFNHRLGIVRKCDLCQGRLAANEAPACVQGCPNTAIRVSVVAVDALRAAATGGRVPGGPPSEITVPSTVYRTAHAERATTPAQLVSPRPRRSHLPLVIMLVLTQLAVGALVADVALRQLADRPGTAGVAASDAVLALVAGGVALLASVFHLGRPRYAYRAIIGVRHSWLSREILAFGAFTSLAALYAAVLMIAPHPHASAFATSLGVVAATSGVVAVACSVAVYVVTRRPAWRATRVGPTFALTAAIAGLAGVLCMSELAWLAGSPRGIVDAEGVGSFVPALLLVLVVAKVSWEALVTSRAGGTAGGAAVPGRRHERAGARPWATRLAAAGVGGALVAVGAVADAPWFAAVCSALALVALVAGELAERILFFERSEPPA